MNALEAAYGLRLKAYLDAGTISAYSFEAARLPLPGNMTFLPDFEVVLPDGRKDFHEVKAMWKNKRTGKEYPGWQEDAKVKFKAATAAYPGSKWYLAARRRDGSWEVSEYVNGKRVKPCSGSGS